MKRKSNILTKLENKEEIQEFLDKPTLSIAEALTGLLADNGLIPKSYILSAGRIVQGAIKGKLLTQLGLELSEYRKKGRIKEDYFASHKNQVTLLELLEFIDTEIPDEEIFNAVKSIFFASVSTDSNVQKEEVAYQLLLLCKKLNSMEILIIKTCYEVYLGKHIDINTGINSYGEWVNAISEKIGYELPELVSSSDDKLVNLGLLSSRSYSDKSGINPSKEFRLTKLGIKLCNFITEFN